jgi:muconate cycloisomerase
MFATAVKGLKFLEGSYDRHLVRESLAAEDITFRRGGLAPMLSGCGLGIRIADDKLHAMTVRKESLL